MSYTIPHYIGGRTFHESSGPCHQVYNPAEGKPIGELFSAGKECVDKAVALAKEASPHWAAVPPAKRAQILFKFRALLIEQQASLAQLVTREHGKTLADAQGSIARGIELVEFHCGLIKQLQGQFSADVSQHIDCHTIRQPLGVCAGVSPFNFPVMVPLWMMIPAIAAGNTFLLKPSEQDPSASLRLFELLTEAGLPPGVANCLMGDKSTVGHLLQHPDVAAFTAVGSSEVAEFIYKTAIANGKRAHTFGSAKNHCVVMPDADLDNAARDIVGAAYGSAGERCMAISVLVAVGQGTADALIAKMIPKIRDIRINSGDKPDTDMGPLISAVHRERVITAIDAGLAEGARLIIDGRSFKHPQYPQGFFLGPCLFDEVHPGMSIYQNEIFGPVLVVLRVDNFEEALGLVNNHQFGNGTAIFTKDGFYAREYSHRVQVGMVGVNIPIPVPIASHPFGGWKRSVFGDTNMHGEESIDFYTKRKSITSKWPTTLNQNSFTMPTHG